MVDRQIQGHRPAQGFADEMKPLAAGRVGHRQRVRRQGLHGPGVAVFRHVAAAVTAQIEPDDAVAFGQHRQPFGPDAPVDADAVMEQDCLRRRAPRRRHLDGLVVDVPVTGIDGGHGGPP